jgi:hypothetical protein
VPWEIGLAETQQTLVLNDLRSRVWVQVDGQMKTGRDVVIAALLGADEVGFATAPLIAAGCIMMRACHLNTCPVGIATQDPELRKRFEGTPEHVIDYLFFVAEEARALMARSAYAASTTSSAGPSCWRRRRRSTTGRRVASTSGWCSPRPRRRRTRRAGACARRPRRCRGARLGPDRGGARRDRPPPAGHGPVRGAQRQPHGRRAALALGREGPRRRGLPPETIRFGLHGSAGQSFGAWLAPGVELSLVGDANDYCGKGLSGGVISVRPPDDAGFAAEENVIVGNTCSTAPPSGRAFFRGSRASASRSATRARARSSRASATMAAST